MIYDEGTYIWPEAASVPAGRGWLTGDGTRHPVGSEGAGADDEIAKTPFPAGGHPPLRTVKVSAVR